LLIGRLSELVLGVDDTHVVLIVATEGTLVAQRHFNVVADFGRDSPALFHMTKKAPTLVGAFTGVQFPDEGLITY
jgi:hypothetical protein